MTDNSNNSSLIASRKSNSTGNAMQSCMSFLYRTYTIQRWIEKILGEPIYGIDQQETPPQQQLLYNYLVDGVILCRLMSTVKPDSIPRFHPKGSLNFKIRENILFFLQALEDLGISRFYQFQVNDLFERKNYYKVLEALEVLADVVASSNNSNSSSSVTTSNEGSCNNNSAEQLTSDEEALLEFPDQLVSEVENILKKLHISQVKRQPLKKSLFVNEPKRLSTAVNNNYGTLRNSISTTGSSGSSILRNSMTTSKPPARPKILSEAQIIEKATPFLKTWIIVQSLVRGYKTRILYRKRTRMAAYRQKIVKELLQTEEVYVGNLEHLSKYYFTPIKEGASKLNIKLEYLTLQISNLDVIINYNKKLLNMIQPKVKDWSHNQRIGDVFKQFTLYLKVYTQYVKEYNKIFDVLNGYRKNNSKFEAFITEKEFNDPLKSIGAYLILPIQRIPRYTMLLENIVKNTWADHTDYADLSESLKKMLDVASYVNEKTRDAENIVKVTEIQNNFIGKFDNLAEPHRRFVYEGSLNVISNGKESNRIFYLFNDFLIGTKPISSGLVKRKVLYKVKESIRLNLVSIRSLGSKELLSTTTTTTTTTTTLNTSSNSTPTVTPNNSTTPNSPSIVSKPTPISAKLKSSSQTLLTSSTSNNNNTGHTLSASSPGTSPSSKSANPVLPSLSSSAGSTPPLPSTMKPPKPVPPPRRDILKQPPNSPGSSTPPLHPTSVSSTTSTTGESSSATPPLLSISTKSLSTNSFARVSSPLPNAGNLTIGDNRTNPRVVSSPTPGSHKPNHGSYSSGSSGANSGSSSGSNSAHSTPKSMTPITASPSNSQERLIDEIKNISEEKKVAEEKRLVEEKKHAIEAEKQAQKVNKEELMIEFIDSFGTVILRLLCSSQKDKEHWMTLFKKVQEEIDTKKIVNDEANKRAQEKAGLAIAALSQQYATLRVKGKSVGLSTLKGIMSTASGEDDETSGNTESTTTPTTSENQPLPGESNYQMYRRLTLAKRGPKEGETTSGGTPTPIKSVPQSTSKEDLALSSGDECSSPNSALEKKDGTGTKSKSSWFSSLRKKKTKTPSLQEAFGHLDNNITVPSQNNNNTNSNTPTTTIPTTTTTQE